MFIISKTNYFQLWFLSESFEHIFISMNIEHIYTSLITANYWNAYLFFLFPHLRFLCKDDVWSLQQSVVYFSTYAYPLYYTSDLLARGFPAAF